MDESFEEEQSQTKAEHGRSTPGFLKPPGEGHKESKLGQIHEPAQPCVLTPHSPTATVMLLLFSTSAFHHPGPWMGSDHGPVLNQALRNPSHCLPEALIP